MKRFIFLLCLFALCGCAARKQVVQTPPKPLHRTAQVAKSTITATMDEEQYTLYCSIQAIRDSVISMSLQLIPGLEVVRLYATPDQVIGLDKMGKRYISTSWTELAQTSGTDISWQYIQRIAMGEEFTIEKSWSKSFTTAGHFVTINLQLPEIIYDEEVAIRPINLQKYRRVDIHELLETTIR